MTTPQIFFSPSFSLPDVLSDPIDLIWRLGTPFEVMNGRTAYQMVSYLRYSGIIILIINRQTDVIYGDSSRWICHASIRLFWPQSMAQCTRKKDIIRELQFLRHDTWRFICEDSVQWLWHSLFSAKTLHDLWSNINNSVSLRYVRLHWVYIFNYYNVKQIAWVKCIV